MIVIPRVTKPLVVQQSPIPRQNLALWLRADRGVVLDTTSTPTVSQWLDQSGNNNHFTQSIKTRQPFLKTVDGFPVVSFEGAHSLAGMTFPQTDAFSIYIVVKSLTDGSYHNTVDFLTPGGLIYPYGTNTLLFSDGGFDGMIPTGLVTGQWNKACWIYKPNEVDGYQTFNNGALVAQRQSSNNAIAAGAPGTVGSHVNQQAEFCNAFVKHILIYTRRHSVQELTRVISKL